MEKREPSYTAGNVNWYSHMENSMEVPQKMKKNYHMTQHPSFWVYIQLFVVVQSLSPVGLFATPWTVACQAPLQFAQIHVQGVGMLSNHLILCCPLLILPSIFPSIRVFSEELALRIRWPKYWSFSFSISPSNEYSGLISFRID